MSKPRGKIVAVRRRTTPKASSEPPKPQGPRKVAIRRATPKPSPQPVQVGPRRVAVRRNEPPPPSPRQPSTPKNVRRDSRGRFIQRWIKETEWESPFEAGHHKINGSYSPNLSRLRHHIQAQRIWETMERKQQQSDMELDRYAKELAARLRLSIREIYTFFFST